jgi:hypothetical protein
MAIIVSSSAIWSLQNSKPNPKITVKIINFVNKKRQKKFFEALEAVCIDINISSW